MKSDFVFALEKAQWPALVLSDSGVIHRANPAAAAAFGGVTEGVGASAASIWSPENDVTVEVFLARHERSAAEPGIVKLRTKGGQSVPFLACVSAFEKDGQKLYLVQLLKPGLGGPPSSPEANKAKPALSPAPEVREESALESGLAHKQKLECALQLTRTVALDFNNALTSILGHTSLMLSRMELNDPWRSSLVEVEKSAEKAAEVSADLAAFSRQEKETNSQVAGNLNDLVRRTVELFQSSGSSAAAWSLQLEPRLYTVSFEEAKMQQAFVKVLDNAIQALGESGQIVVRSRNQDVATPTQDGHARLAPGHYVCVEFEDSGCGIAPEVLPRIFEPFFTTKQSPQHRGLGLAWVYGIVTNHGGSVAVSSQVGCGTTVRIYLPAQKKIVRDRALQTDDLNGTDTILMIDDEELLLTMGEMVLSSFGYRVLTANSGSKALEIFSQNQDQIDLVITDLVMPRMSGRELIEQLRQLSPKVKIICSSGYIRALSTNEQEMYLQKPFTSLDLLRKVKEALTSPDVS
jgi:two-component system, cell cycle sensor histidine kinase and response regulator CckA